MTTKTLSKVTASVLTALMLTATVTQSAEAKMKRPPTVQEDAQKWQPVKYEYWPPYKIPVK